MKSKLHALAGTIALLCVAAFWTSTLVSEIFLGHDSVTAVKQGILAAMWLLLPAMAATGASGFALARVRTGRRVQAKARRMKIIAANGLVVLLPCAWTLAALAGQGRFDALFYAVQGLELAAGAVNGALLVLNMRDGLRLSGRWSGRRPQGADT